MYSDYLRVSEAVARLRVHSPPHIEHTTARAPNHWRERGHSTNTNASSHTNSINIRRFKMQSDTCTYYHNGLERNDHNVRVHCPDSMLGLPSDQTSGKVDRAGGGCRAVQRMCLECGSMSCYLSCMNGRGKTSNGSCPDVEGARTTRCMQDDRGELPNRR